MSDGSGCLHEAMKNSFKIPTSMECAQCGKSELLILRHRIASAEQDKLGLIKVTHGLQDRIALLEDRIAFKDRFIKELEATAKLADAALTAIGALINESHGVAWLHLNGDIAPWGELLAGGRYEGWLIPLSDYWEARQEQEK